MRNKPEEKILICVKCGHNVVNEVSGSVNSNNVVETVSNYGYSENTLKIMDMEKPMRRLPTTNIECPKCYNNLAFWWMLQTRSADEVPLNSIGALNVIIPGGIILDNDATYIIIFFSNIKI